MSSTIIVGAGPGGLSAGAGAAAALDILSREADSDVQDWDSPPKD